MQNLVFRKIYKSEVNRLFQLILERMKWMDEVGIEHWNKYEYDTLFPLTYYEMECEKGELYVLVTEDTNEIVSGAVLKEKDNYWEDDEPAYFIHNFVAGTGWKGAGSRFIEEVEKLAKEQKKKYVRLDVLVGSETLVNYYSKRGYVEKGRCQDGAYAGILMEKKVG